MAIEHRVQLGLHILSLLQPEWEKNIRPREVYIASGDERHLLKFVFGSFAAGKERVETYSGKTLIELGLLPRFKEEGLTLLRQWHIIVCNARTEVRLKASA